MVKVNLSPIVSLSSEQFQQLCFANPEGKLNILNYKHINKLKNVRRIDVIILLACKIILFYYHNFNFDIYTQELSDFLDKTKITFSNSSIKGAKLS